MAPEDCKGDPKCEQEKKAEERKKRLEEWLNELKEQGKVTEIDGTDKDALNAIKVKIAQEQKIQTEIENRLTEIVEAGGDIIDLLQTAHQMLPTNTRAKSFALNKVLGKFGAAASLYEVGDKLMDGKYGAAVIAGGRMAIGRANVLVTATELMLFLGRSAVPDGLNQRKNQSMYWYIDALQYRPYSPAYKRSMEKALKYEKEYQELKATYEKY